MPIAQAASRAHAAYQEIRRKILVGEFPPGMRLREVEVAEMLALGRTPVRTFHPHRDPVFLMEPGDAVTFTPIDAREFDALDRAAERGEVIAELVAS